MKTILLTTLASLMTLSTAQAYDYASTITLQSEVVLSSEGSDYAASAEFCFDVKQQQQLPKDECYEKANQERRLCSVLVYIIEDHGESRVVPPGAQFRVTEYFGPAIAKDWSKKTSYIKYFADLQGSETRAPQLIISCNQTKDGFLPPFSFSTKEIAKGLRSLLDIK